MPLDLRHLVERAKESEPGADVSTPEKVVAAFDARSLCKLVVVPFEKQLLKGRLGGSSDPYVSNPARLPMVEPVNDVKSATDRQLLNQLYNVLEFADGADEAMRKRMFSFAYALVLQRPPSELSLLSFNAEDSDDIDSDILRPSILRVRSATNSSRSETQYRRRLLNGLRGLSLSV